jgi:hypothetical protein
LQQIAIVVSRSVSWPQAVEKGPPANADCPELYQGVRSIASLQRIGKYASARRFSRAPRIWTFLNSLEATAAKSWQET